MINRSAIFGLNCYVAGMCALYIAFFFDLPNPWWALLTVFFTSQPGHEGGIWAKAIFRLSGTIIGLAFVFITLPNLVNEPEALIACLAIWLGICLMLSLLDRTPRSYMPMLAGYTALLIGAPLLDSPGNVFDVAIDRTEEILIGVFCASAVHAFVFPRHLRDIILDKVRACEAEASAWGLSTLNVSPQSRIGRLKYANAITDLTIALSTLPYEPSRTRDQTLIVQALIGKLASILPIIDAINDRVALLERSNSITPELRDVISKLESWLSEKNASDQGLKAIVDTCDGLLPHANQLSWTQLNQCGLVSRVKSLALIWQDCRVLTSGLEEPGLHRSKQLDTLLKGSHGYRLHVDPMLAMWSGAAAALSVILTGYFCISIQWDPGTFCIAIAAVMSSLFSTFDDPTPVLKKSLLWMIVAIPIGFIYVFGVLPEVDDFLGLCVVLSPLIFLSGYWMATPKTALQGLMIAIISTSVIGLQSHYVGNFESFWNISIASVIGDLAALATIQSVRIIAAQTVVKRVLRRGWMDLADLAEHGARGDQAFSLLMLDRVGMLVSRLPSDSFVALNGLRDLRLGANLAELGAAFNNTERQEKGVLDVFLRHLSVLLRKRVRGKSSRTEEITLDDEFEALRRASDHIADANLRIQAITALTGIRNELLLLPASFKSLS
jgi:uncharacterized membrane protein YccC